MFFEREKSDYEFIDKLKEDLDNEKIFVTEDLIQRTLLAAKESDNTNQKNVANRRKIRMKVWVRPIACVAACIMFLLIINNEGILPMYSKKDAMERSSTSTGNESAQSSENKSLAGNVDNAEAFTEDALLDSGITKDEVVGDKEDIVNENQSNDEQLFGATISESLEQEKGEDANQDTNIVGHSINSNDLDKNTSSLAGSSILQKDTLVNKDNVSLETTALSEFIKEEQEKDSNLSNIKYITLHDNVVAEKMIITELVAQVEGLKKENIEFSTDMQWDYKVFVLNTEDGEISYYYVSKMGNLMIGKFDPENKRDESIYRVEEIDKLIKLLD